MAQTGPMGVRSGICLRLHMKGPPASALGTGHSWLRLCPATPFRVQGCSSTGQGLVLTSRMWIVVGTLAPCCAGFSTHLLTDFALL
jgi:hypothetical protein